MGARPLEGIRVLDISTVLAAPLATALMGEFGAEVIKVESPDGDPARHYPPKRGAESAAWEQIGRGKRSVTADLHVLAGRDVVHRLVATSDVVVANFRPDALRRFELDFEDLRRVKPDVVLVHLTAFGRTGPYAERPGFARVAEGFAGLTHRSGEVDGPPMFSGYAIADGVAGYYAAMSAVLALRARDQTGEAQLVDLGLYEPLLRMMEDFIPIQHATGESVGRIGNANPAIVPNGLFPTADNRWLVLPASTDQMWERLVAAMGVPGLARFDSMQARVDNRELIHAAVAGYTSQHTLDWLVASLNQAGVACGPVNTAADIVDDPQIKARESVVTTEDRHGHSVKILQSAGTFSGFTPTIGRPAPAIGEDTDAVLRGVLGMEPHEIASLRALGAI